MVQTKLQIQFVCRFFFRAIKDTAAAAMAIPIIATVFCCMDSGELPCEGVDCCGVAFEGVGLAVAFAGWELLGVCVESGMLSGGEFCGVVGVGLVVV